MSNGYGERRGGGHGGHGGHRGGGRHGGHGGGGGERRGVPLSDLDPALTEVSRKVIGCAIEVHKELGPGFPAGIYRKALTLMLEDEDVSYVLDKAFDVEFDGDKVGEVVADLYAGERFLVTIMAEHSEMGIGTQPRAELRAQLRAADLELGLIINFGERRLKDGLVRVLNPDKLNALKGNDEGDAYEDDDEGDEGGED